MMLRGDFKVFQKPAKERTPEEMGIDIVFLIIHKIKIIC